MNNNFRRSKIKGIVQGLLLGFLCVWLFFYPFFGEVSINPTLQPTTFITLFWNSLRILLLIAFEIHMVIVWIHLKQNIDRYENYKDTFMFSNEIADEITNIYMILGWYTVSFSGGIVILIQSAIDFFY
jgi:hypothetical protein